MSRVVHKVGCPLSTCYVRFSAPMTIMPVALQLQNGQPCMWFERDADEQPMVEHTLALVGTGHPVPDHATYVGTVQLQGGALVLHGYTALVYPYESSTASAAVQR